jgi:hypothetical protein
VADRLRDRLTRTKGGIVVSAELGKGEEAVLPKSVIGCLAATLASLAHRNKNAQLTQVRR